MNKFSSDIFKTYNLRCQIFLKLVFGRYESLLKDKLRNKGWVEMEVK